MALIINPYAEKVLSNGQEIDEYNLIVGRYNRKIYETELEFYLGKKIFSINNLKGMQLGMYVLGANFSDDMDVLIKIHQMSSSGQVYTKIIEKEIKRGYVGSYVIFDILRYINISMLNDSKKIKITISPEDDDPYEVIKCESSKGSNPPFLRIYCDNNCDGPDEPEGPDEPDDPNESDGKCCIEQMNKILKKLEKTEIEIGTAGENGQSIVGELISVDDYVAIIEQIESVKAIPVCNIAGFIPTKPVSIDGICQNNNKECGKYLEGMQEILCKLKGKTIDIDLQGFGFELKNVKILEVGKGIIKAQMSEGEEYILNICHICQINNIDSSDLRLISNR